jgi:hypothetical protein
MYYVYVWLWVIPTGLVKTLYHMIFTGNIDLPPDMTRTGFGVTVLLVLLFILAGIYLAWRLL